MIRGYIAVINSYSPSPQVTPRVCRKASMKLIVEKFEFYIRVEGTDYSFKVIGNIRAVDKHNIANGVVRIGFTTPNLDVMISCNPEDLKAFIYSVEVIKDMKVPPPKCCDKFHAWKLKCICKGRKFSKYKRYHINDFDCPFSVLIENLCVSCCYRILESYNGGDARKIVSTWKLKVDFSGRQMTMHSITVTSFPYLVEIRASGQYLEEIPEAIGSLPCLRELGLSDNRLGQATNWNWLTSPFIRENLCTLYLDRNGFSTVPEDIAQLKNLKNLLLDGNSLTELPAALASLNSLRWLSIGHNKLEVLPAWLYRKERFRCLYTGGNDFHRAEIHSIPQLKSEDFKTLAVPSLFKTVTKHVLTERLAFWECNIPDKVASYLEGAYHCRCGSVVFTDTIGRVVQCQIAAEALTEANGGDVIVPILIRLCSYKCYELIERYMV